MNILDLLKGKEILVKTDVGVDVTLVIKEVKENHHSRQITPDTPANDWWGESVEWSTYTVYFTNGHTKTYDSLNAIKLIE